MSSVLNTHSVSIERVEAAAVLDRGAVRRWATERFSADRMVEDYLALYERILADWHSTRALAGAAR